MSELEREKSESVANVGSKRERDETHRFIHSLNCSTHGTADDEEIESFWVIPLVSLHREESTMSAIGCRLEEQRLDEDTGGNGDLRLHDGGLGDPPRPRERRIRKREDLELLEHLSRIQVRIDQVPSPVRTLDPWLTAQESVN